MNITKILAGAGMLVGLTLSQAFGQEVTFRISADSPSSGNVCKGMLDVWAAKVETESNGRIKFEMLCDGLLSKVGDTVDRVQTGVADIGWDIPGNYGKRFGSLGVTGVPGLYTDPAVAGGALWNAYVDGKLGHELTGVKVLWFQAVNNTAYYLKKKPELNANFSGLKIAMGNSMRANMIKGMGGVPIALNPPEYYQAISRGTADGAQSTIGAIAAYKLDELTHYYIYGPFGGGVTITVMNQAKYDALPDDLKKVIDDNAGHGASIWASAYLRDYESHYLTTKMLSIPGNERSDLSTEDTQAWAPAFEQAASDWSAGINGGPAVLEAFKTALAAENGSSAK